MPPAEIAGELWAELTGRRPDADAIAISGREDVLPGRFRVAAAAGACVGVTTHAAAELLRRRGIPVGGVSAELRHAAAAFQSERLLRVDGGPAGDVWSPLSGDYRAADGWVRLHCNYPHHEAAVCRAMVVRHDRAELADAVAAATSWQVQEDVVAAGGAAAAMRSSASWRGHPQARVLAADPLVGTEVWPDADVRAPASSDRPLGGVRVLDLTHVIAGPVAGRTLAAHGAEVLHVGAEHLPVIRPLALDTGMGTRSTYLDLRTVAGRDRLWRLIADCDVLVQSYRPDSLAHRGFTMQRLRAVRPGIVLAELDAYGWSGPWRGRRGFDSLVQLATGIAAEGGESNGGGRPGPLPVQAMDHATGWLTAAAVMIALGERAEHGGSRRIRLSLARTAMWLDSLGRKNDTDTDADFTELLQIMPSEFGELTYVPPAGTVPGCGPRWTNPSPLPGRSPAEWQPAEVDPETP